jgi:hypothetical protein
MTTATNWFAVLQTSEVLREELRREADTEVSIRSLVQRNRLKSSVPAKKPKA